MTATTLAGADDSPAHLDGHGPIPAELARQLARHAHWRRLLYDPADGEVLAVGKRFPTTLMRRLTESRDGLCRWPGCTHPATQTDLDHTLDHDHGGPTQPDNLGSLCRHHHRVKGEDTGWALAQPTPGHFVWTSPTGREYHVHPEPVWADDTHHGRRQTRRRDDGTDHLDQETSATAIRDTLPDPWTNPEPDF